MYPIPYIYHSFALIEMQRTQRISHTVKYNILNYHVRCFCLAYDSSLNHAHALFLAHRNSFVFPLDRRKTIPLYCTECTVLMRLIPAFRSLILWDPLCF